MTSQFTPSQLCQPADRPSGRHHATDPDNTAQRRKTVLAGSGESSEGSQYAGSPVSSQEGNLQGPLLPELQEILPDAFDARVQRAGIVNVWADPSFHAAVEATRRKNLIIAGVTTDVCLVFPAVDAVNDSFEVQAVMFASGSPYTLSEDMSRRRMEGAGVTLTATSTIIAELAQDWSTPVGQQLIQLLFMDVIPPIAALDSERKSM